MGLLLQSLPYIGTLFVVIFSGLYFYVTRNFGYWKKRNIPEVKPLPLVGNFKDIALSRKSIGDQLASIYKKHKKKPVVGIYAFTQPVLQVHDPAILKDILVKESNNFMDRSFRIRKNTDPIGARSLFGDLGEKWKWTRSLISPTFTSGKMKKMYEHVIECGKLLTKTLEEQGESEVPAYEIAARYTTDSIASCAFGIDGNTLKNPQAEFRNKLRLFFEFTFTRSIAIALSTFAPQIAEFFNLKTSVPEAEKFVKETTLSTIAYREKNGIQRGDFLDSLIQLKKENEGNDIKETSKLTKYPVEEEDLFAHSWTFLTAGFETSANTISYALYELALNQEVQERLRKAVQQAAESDNSLSYETLHGLKYLDMVFKETMRKYPPLPFLDRQNLQPYKVPGTELVLPPGSRVAIPLHGIQMDPDYYPDPQKFDPERFSEENEKNIVPYTYMPFGEGPRNCVGKRFAQMQVKRGLVDIIRNFSVQPSATTPKEIKEFNPRNFLLQPKEPVKLVFRKL